MSSPSQAYNLQRQWIVLIWFLHFQGNIQKDFNSIQQYKASIMQKSNQSFSKSDLQSIQLNFR